MTIVVSVKSNDGIVMAADSATTLARQDGTISRVYTNANKLFNLIKGCPIGAMTYGSGAIGTASISSLSKDLRLRLCDESDEEYYVDPKKYTIEQVAQKAREFFFSAYQAQYGANGLANFWMGYRVGGYSRPGDQAELWEFAIHENVAEGPLSIYQPHGYGPVWAGQPEALDRLVYGISGKFVEVMARMSVSEADALHLYQQVCMQTWADLAQPAMPIQDSIELARFLATTAARFADFQENASTVGGPIDIAAITKHEGFKWVSRKHFYQQELNVRSTDHVC